MSDHSLYPAHLEEIAGNYPTLYFMRIPKCAGQHVRECFRSELGSRFFEDGAGSIALNIGPEGHWNGWPVGRFGLFGEVQCTDYPEFKTSLVFSTIRNPYSMLVSMYTFGFPYNPPRYNISKWPFDSFEDFVKCYCDKTFPWMYSTQHELLHYQLFDAAGSCATHLLVRTERLQEALPELARVMGLTYTPPEKNVNRSRKGIKADYRLWYTDSLAEMVCQACGAELDMLGYTFEGPDERIILDGSTLHWTWGNVCKDKAMQADIKAVKGRTSELASVNYHKKEYLLWFSTAELLTAVCKRMLKKVTRLFRRG